MLGPQFRLCHAVCLSRDLPSLGAAFYPSIHPGGPMSSAPKLPPGVQKYVDCAQKLLAQREAALARMKAMKFDTIAVHGLYTVEEALERNQGAVIEPQIGRAH